jgi:CheY-like chemotaxis protein
VPPWVDQSSFAAFADAAARSFESVGRRTVVALGSTAAIDGFDSNAIDVVVTDIKLPEGEPRGSVLTRMIKNKRPHVPIILMTAHPELLKQEGTPPGQHCPFHRSRKLKRGRRMISALAKV